MGATGQPGGTGRRGDGAPRPWWGDHRTTLFTVFGTVAGICTAAMGVVDRGTQIVLLAVSVVLFLLGLAALVRVRTYKDWLDAAWNWSREHPVLVTAVTVVALAATTAGAVGLQRARSCEDPTEVAVMVPEDGAAGFAGAADAFERESVTAFSCPPYHVTTFALGWPVLRAAFASGWAEGPDRSGEASLDLGPRPDVWVAESRTQADIVAEEGLGQPFSLVDRTVVAGTPLVLAVPEAHAEALRATTGPDDTVRELVDAAGAADLDVVRANPDTSFAAALHTVPLYADAGPGAESLELDLGRALEQVGLPPGTDGALLCRLDELSEPEPPRVAVLTTERAAADGGAACPASGSGGGRTALVPFYPGSTLGLDYTAVRVGWTAGEPAERRSRGAQAFVEWLVTPEGQAVLERQARVRGLDGQPPAGADGPLPGLEDAPVVEPDTSRVAYTRVRSAEEQYRTARRPARVLALVDASASMARPADGDRSRTDVAERGVLGALGHLGGSDQVAIWSFSGGAGSSPRPVLGLTESGAARAEAPDGLAGVRPDGATPLYDAIDAGTSYLAGLDPDGAARRHLTAVVVLTDGENHPGAGPGAELTADDLVRSARAEGAAGVRVYVVAVGEASCQVSDLRRIAAEWDGECWDSSFGELESTLGSLFGQLGGR
ncbi:substrate-binding domain-containing protein [Promicromonospora sukumoe]|uniref:vWA domain-containing protein n=1 Tax=Promicromonospora sukumoe TaxID=88382 RepID=UPI0036593B5B